MVKKRISKDYLKLSENTQKRLGSFLVKVHKSGTSFTELRLMNDVDFALALGIKKGKRIKGNKFSNIESNRRLLSQTQKTKERREGSIKLAEKPYIKFGFRGKRLEALNKELIRTSGNVFSAISYEVEKKYFSHIKDKKIRERKSDKKAKKLLLIPKSERDKLKIVDKNILDTFSP